jgi:O-antigen/teichoic acid export membrane protein
MSSFGSKVLVYVLQRVYTALLSPDQNSAIKLITSTSNLILPIMYLGIVEAVIRFGMENKYRRSDIFSTGIYTALGGYTVLWLLYPLISQLESISGYAWLVYLYCLTSSMRTIVTNFVRVSGFVRLFALDGAFTTLTTIGFNLLFLLHFKMGVAGYVLGTVVADALSAICLFFFLRLYRFLKLRGLSRQAVRDMFRYSLPMIPPAIFWWVTNTSDLYFIEPMLGSTINGLYAQAYVIPNLILIVSTFFTQAWQLSAFTEYKSAEGERFFSTVFRSYYTFIFLIASGLILLIKPITGLMYDPAYFEAWRMSPLLILAVSFSCLVTFLGAIYNAEKKNAMVSVTTAVGGVLNLILNALLIPVFGVQGAAVATFASFLVVFIIRAVDTRKYIRIKMQPARVAATLLLLIAQALTAIADKPYSLPAGIVIFLFIVFMNFGYVLFLAKRFLQILPYKKKRRRA